MPEEEEEKTEETEEGEGITGKIVNFFSTVGKGVEKTGEVTSKAPSQMSKVAQRTSTEEEEESDLSDRLQELKKMEVEAEEEGEWREEEEDWDEDREEELERPASDRLADIFSGVFKAPASRMAGFFTGLDDDLHKANMDITPVRYLTLLLGIGTIVAIAAFLFVWLLLGSLLFMILAPPLAFIITIFIGRSRPSSRIGSRASEVNQEIPYALRHMATQLSSGIGLPETMTSVADADYGALSEEFRRTLQDMRTGESMVDALTSLRERVESDSLGRAIRQVQRTLRTGGNLSRTLSLLADEAAFDLRMNLRDYTQSLNMMAMIYMFAAAVIPPLLIVVMIVAKFMGGSSFPPEMVGVMYLVAFPFLLGYMVTVFKRMEPEV